MDTFRPWAVKQAIKTRPLIDRSLPLKKVVGDNAIGHLLHLAGLVEATKLG